MEVGPTSSATAPGGAAASSNPAASVDYNQFLRLLIAQMKNQDPTKPMDSTQFISQLASFSAVEQAIQTNAKLDALMTSSALSQADGLVGRSILSADGATTGTIAGVRIVSGGAVAILNDGKEIALEAGVTLF
jgi:flagellar basal-body rod modification protein FlgD